MNCPRCSQSMTQDTLQAHLGREVTIDLCISCQAFWFDTRESLQLTPGATLKLFRTIGAHVAAPRSHDEARCLCPRCSAPMRLAHDQQRNTKFQYLSCPKGHGRFTSFYDFLREKDFIRPVSPAQLAELREKLQILNCSNCGAAIDLTTRSSCDHCGSAISMLDTKHAQELVDELRKADSGSGMVDPTLPMRLLQARHDVVASIGSADRGEDWFRDVSTSGLVGAGLRALIRLHELFE